MLCAFDNTKIVYVVSGSITLYTFDNTINSLSYLVQARIVFPISP